MLFCVRWPVGASNRSGVRCEAGLCDPPAAHSSPACRPGAMPGLAPRAVQRRPAGTTGRLAAARDQCISYGDQSAQLKEIREVRPDVAAWSFSSQQATLRRLNRAFAGFFRRVSRPGARLSAVQASAPVQQCRWPKDGEAAAGSPTRRRVYLEGNGHLKVSVQRQVQGRVRPSSCAAKGAGDACCPAPCRPGPWRPPGPRSVSTSGSPASPPPPTASSLPNPRFGRAAAASLDRSARAAATHSPTRDSLPATSSHTAAFRELTPAPSSPSTTC